MTRQRSVEATTTFPPNTWIENEGIKHLHARFATLRMEQLEYLITDTNSRFQPLKNQLSQCFSVPATPVVQNIKNLEAKVENLGQHGWMLLEICLPMRRRDKTNHVVPY